MKIHIFTLIPVFGAIYLLLTLPVAHATTINIYSLDYSATTPVYPNIVLPQPITRTITFQQSGTSWQAIISVSGQALATVYLLKCRSFNPSQCASVVPSGPYTASSFPLTIPVSELVDTTTNNGNLIILARVTSTSGGSWYSFLHKIQGTGSGYQQTSTEIPSVDLTATNVFYAQSIQNFINTNGGMIPFNPSWVTQITYPGANLLYRLRGGTNIPPLISSSPQAGNVISSIPNTYDFVFSSDGTIENTPTLTLNPSFTPGNGVCENGQNGAPNNGENIANSCADCGPCPSSQYCNINTNTCQQLTTSLTLLQSNTQVSNCNVQNTISVNVQLNNPPAGYSIQSKVYSLAGQAYTASCPESSTAPNLFQCSLTVPPVPSCSAGSFSIQPNFLNFTISYPNGNNQVIATYSTQFPAVTIGSWVCGNGIAETSLGETSTNCCIDVPCPGGQICSLQTGATPETGICRAPLTNANFIFQSLTPTVFQIYPAGGITSTLKFQIAPTPAGFSAGTPSCQTSCTTTTSSCSGSCSLSCSAPSTSSTQYNATCSLILTLPAYNQSESYTFLPNMTVPVSYNNGTGSLSSTLFSTLPSVTIGAISCGDGTCSPSETSGNCCIDCGCDAGSFCNTANPNTPATGAVCTSGDFQLIIDSVSNTSFIDQTLIHRTNVTGHVMPTPQGFQVYDYFCQLWGGTIPCVRHCSPLIPATPNQFPFQCEIFLPPISNVPTSLITLTPNSLNVTIGYNNGSTVATRQLTKSLGDITITQISHCGDSVCETSLGETSVNCCIDCPCTSGGVCVPGGANQNSACVANTSIQAYVSRINPSPVSCLIQPPVAGGSCAFTQPTSFTINITNAPSSLQILDVVKEYEGQTDDIISQCVSPRFDSTRCSIAFPNIAGNAPSFGGNITPQNLSKMITFTITAQYLANNQPVHQTFVATTNFTLLLKKSDALLTCEEEQRHVSNDLSDYQSERSLILTLLAVLWGLTIGFCICCGIPQCEASFSESCTICNYGIVVSACFTAVALPWLQSVNSNIQQTQAKKDAICAAPTTGALRNAVKETGSIWYAIGTIVAAAVCMFGIGGILKSGFGSTPLGIEGGFFGGGAGGGGGLGGPPLGVSSSSPAATSGGIGGGGVGGGGVGGGGVGGGGVSGGGI